MIRHSRMLTRPWLLLPLAAVFIASHALIFRYALQHKGLSASVAAGVMVLVLIKHLGFFGSIIAFIRRRSRN